jgi:hypothetical protein
LSVWQIIFTCGLFGALLIGLPHWRIWVAMICNFLATMTFADTPTLVGIVDIACAAFLLGAGRQAHIVAFLFACMVPVYWLPTGFPQWSNSATYAIIDVIAYVQLGVIGYGGGGVNFIRRHFGLRHRTVLGTVAFRSDTKSGVAMVSKESA